MTLILGIILALFVFFVVVMIHEFGHFITARLTGMRVLEFGLGIPPKIKKIFTDKKGTDFTINALPIGGFVRIDGEDVRSPNAFKDGAFMSKSWPKRVLVLIAWVVMNLILAWIIFFALFLHGVRPLTIIPIDVGVTNSYFLPSFSESLKTGYVTHSGITLDPIADSIAQKAGIQKGDKVLSIGGVTPYSIDEFVGMIEKGGSLDLTIERGDQKMTFNIIPENGKIGTYIWYLDLQLNPDFIKKDSILQAATSATSETYYSSILTFKLVKKTLGSLFFAKTSEERKEAQESLSGPIGAGNAFVTMVEQSVPMYIILIFVALLSINLAVMNILPFPALDGGRILFTTIYSVCKRIGISKEKFLIFEWYIHAIGFFLLILFMLYVSGLDIFRIIQ